MAASDKKNLIKLTFLITVCNHPMKLDTFWIQNETPYRPSEPILTIYVSSGQ